MQLEKTSHWITIIGNLGLLIGVVLVVLQINQNSQLVREQLYHSSWTDDLNLHLALMGENPAVAVAKAIESPSDITVEEARVLDAYITYWSLAETRRILMAERGMTIDPLSDYVPGSPRFALDMQVLGNAYSKARLDERGAGPLLTPRLQPLRATLSGNENWEGFQRIVEHVKEHAPLVPARSG